MTMSWKYEDTYWGGNVDPLFWLDFLNFDHDWAPFLDFVILYIFL